MLDVPAQKTRTVYDDLVARIRRSVSDGELKQGACIGSEYELAREAGISRVSVRRATELLMREGVLERRPGKGLFVRAQERSTRTVQIVVPDMSFDQCVQVVRGAQSFGMDRGVLVQVYDAHSRLEWDLEVLRQLPKTAPDGALIFSWHHRRFAECLYELQRQGYPFVLVDEELRDIDIPSVTADNYGGGHTAGKAIVAHGHRRIGFIGNLAADTVQARLSGLRDAVNDAGMPFDRALVAGLDTPLDGDWPTAISAATRQVLDRPDRPTALFYADDQTAAHGYAAIKAMGLRIPQDLSVVGFDDNPLCQWLEPNLCTTRQPSMEMGRTAMEMLLEAVGSGQGGRTTTCRHEVLATQWMPRGSLADAHNRERNETGGAR